MKTKYWTFPAGERGVAIDTKVYGVKTHIVKCNFTGSDSIIDMLLETDAIKRQYPDAKIILDIPYFPYARQDRKMNQGESHSLKVICDLINSQNYHRVLTVDPHSDVVEALVNRLEIKQQYEAVVNTIGEDIEYDYLISPDAGALKKIYKLAQYMNTEVICTGKQRDVSTGTILKSYVNTEDYVKLAGKRALIVDDIGDGMGTFVGLAEHIRKTQPKVSRLDVYVTHGIFSKGLDLLTGLFDTVYTYNLMNKDMENHDLLVKNRV